MPENEKGGAFIHVKVPASMREAVVRAAKQQDLNASQYVRRALTRVLSEAETEAVAA